MEPIIAPDENDVRTLYTEILEAWNNRNADDFAAHFSVDGSSVGFDGSPMDGRENIRQHLAQIFSQHMTSAYIHIIREVRRLTPDTALLRAVVGMVPRGQNDINPAVNSLQSMVAVRQQGRWYAALLQTTPAQFHGRPEASEALSKELRQKLAK